MTSLYMGPVDQSVSFTALTKCDPFKKSAKPTISSSLHFPSNPKHEIQPSSTSSVLQITALSKWRNRLWLKDGCFKWIISISGHKLLVGYCIWLVLQLFEAMQNNQRGLGRGNNYLLHLLMVIIIWWKALFCHSNIDRCFKKDVDHWVASCDVLIRSGFPKDPTGHNGKLCLRKPPALRWATESDSPDSTTSSEEELLFRASTPHQPLQKGYNFFWILSKILKPIL